MNLDLVKTLFTPQIIGQIITGNISGISGIGNGALLKANNLTAAQINPIIKGIY